MPTDSAPAVSDNQRWFEMMEERSRMAQSPDIMVRLEACRFHFGQPSPPDWHQREQEHEYRKGFRNGYETAIEHIYELHSKGYGRPREIGNIMGRFLGDLRSWMRRAYAEALHRGFEDRHQTPSLVQAPWRELREAVFQRDGRRCMACDSADNLEAHHLDPVCQGGLPELKNLTTQCLTCHRGPIPPDEPDNLADEQATQLLGALWVVTGIPWSWCDCDAAYCGGAWQLMPARSEDDGDFWWWHITHRKQFFNNRPAAVASLLKSFSRWQSLPQKKDAP